MTTYARRLTVAAGALALVAVLGACSDDPEPTFADPTPSDPTTSATDDEPTPPEFPSAAKEMTKAGAIAFSKFYWDVVSYAQATGDTKTLASISDPTCASCSGGLAWVEKVYGRSGRIVGGEYSTSDEEANPVTADASAAFEVHLTLSSTDQVVRGAGSLNEEFKAKSSPVQMIVSFDEAWGVERWDVG